MGKKLIIKGADFSENGMKETVVTTDISQMYTLDGTQVTSANAGTFTNSDTCYYRFRTTGLIEKQGPANANRFVNKADVEGYKTLSIEMDYVANGAFTVAGQTAGYFVGFFFTDENDNILAFYSSNDDISAYSEALQAKHVKVAQRYYKGTVSIPEGAKWLYLNPYNISSAAMLANYKASISKIVVE